MPKVLRPEQSEAIKQEAKVEKRQLIQDRKEKKSLGEPVEPLIKHWKELSNINLKTNIRLSREWADSLGWVPIFGDLLKSKQFELQALGGLWGIDENGDLIPRDERTKEALTNYLKSQKHKVKAAISLAFLIGVPEAAAVSYAAKGSKLAKVISFGIKAKKAKELVEDIDSIRTVISGVSEQGVDRDTVINLLPVALRHLGGKYELTDPAKAATIKYTGSFMRHLPRESLDQVLDSGDPGEEELVIAEVQQALRDLKPETQTLPLAA